MKTLLKTLVAALAALAMAPTLMATLITFDDLPGIAGVIPNGYNGLNWSSNFGYLNGDSAIFTPSGYHNGVVSHSNVAYNGFGTPAAFFSSNPFNFNSVYLTGAWNDGLNIEVQGFNGANLIYDQTVIVNASGPSFFNFNFLGVTEVNFISSGGVNHGYGGGGLQFAMDNLTINNTVPDAGSTLPLLGFASLGLVALRRKLRC